MVSARDFLLLEVSSPGLFYRSLLQHRRRDFLKKSLLRLLVFHPVMHQNVVCADVFWLKRFSRCDVFSVRVIIHQICRISQQSKRSSDPTSTQICRAAASPMVPDGNELAADRHTLETAWDTRVARRASPVHTATNYEPSSRRRSL